MHPRLVHITFPHAGPWGDEMATAFRELAADIGRTPGLLWKVWTEDRAAGRAGGTYLFRTAQAAQAYLGVHLPRLAAFGIAGAAVEQYDANVALSMANRALPQGALSPATDGACTTLADVEHQGMEQFLATFAQDGLALRQAHGSLGATVAGVRSDPSRAIVLIDWKDEQSFQEFRADPRVPPTMKRGGATRPPLFTMLMQERHRFGA